MDIITKYWILIYFVIDETAHTFLKILIDVCFHLAISSFLGLY